MKLSPNQVQEEIQRVAQNNYRKLVKRVTLRNLRGFHDEVVEYRYPVTALIGTNGGGKSTILGASAMAYKNVKPGQFFPKSFVGDEGMADWAIEFELVDRDAQPGANVRRTARFAQQKWRRDGFPERHVEYIEIQRTVPAGELPKFKKFIGGNDPGVVVHNLNPSTITYAGAVLDKNIAGYRVAQLPTNPSIKMYVGVTQNAQGYSQFHFGAGEASVIATVDRIENSPENSLILIEEIENGLHPVAVKLMVQYLQNAARRKRLQVIFTTHSQDAVDELPSEGIWASINKRTFNGILSIDSLRAITGQVPDQRVVFVEDEFVKEWFENAMRRSAADLAPTTKVFPAGGYPNVVRVSQFHNDNPAIQIPSVALVDGDIYDPAAGTVLPDHARFIGQGCPESIVFDYIFEHRIELSSLIRQRCLLSGFTEARIVEAIESVRNSACDPHIIYSEISVRLDFASAIHIRSGLIDLYNERNPDFWQDIIEFVRQQHA